MTRIDSILLRARDSLSDYSKQRWSDERLLRLVDEAQKDIARHSKLLKGQYTLPLLPNISHYSLPEDLWLITRAAYNSEKIELLSYDQMDEQGRKDLINSYDNYRYERNRSNTKITLGSQWELDTADQVTALIYDNRDMQEIRVYPIPTLESVAVAYTFSNSGYLEDTIYALDTPYGLLAEVETPDSMLTSFGVTVEGDSVTLLINNDCTGVESVEPVGFDSPYGIVGSLVDSVYSVGFHGDGPLGITVSIDDYTLDGPYGLVSSLYDPDVDVEVYDGTFGVVSEISETEQELTVWYVRLPATITDYADNLELPSMFDTAIRYYVVGNAFLDDNDAGYKQKGLDNMSLYERELGLATQTEALDGVRNASNLTTSYRGPFE